MSLRKLNDEKTWKLAEQCISTEHNPPSHVCLESGTYEWTYPACGHKTVFVVSRPQFTAHEKIALDYT